MQDPVDSFLNCHQGGHCTHLQRGGKLFLCAIPSGIQYFNKAFSKNLKIDERDYIDIFQVKSMKEISDFLTKPTPFCRYCNVNERSGGHKACVSGKDVREWTGKYKGEKWIE